MPSKNAVIKGGSANLKGDELYKYKAEKYHYKIQQKLKEMQKQGKAIPEGYAQYLKPFQH